MAVAVTLPHCVQPCWVNAGASAPRESRFAVAPQSNFHSVWPDVVVGEPTYEHPCGSTKPTGVAAGDGELTAVALEAGAEDAGTTVLAVAVALAGAEDAVGGVAAAQPTISPIPNVHPITCLEKLVPCIAFFPLITM